MDFKVIESDMNDGRWNLTPFNKVTKKKGDLYQDSLFPIFLPVQHFNTYCLITGKILEVFFISTLIKYAPGDNADISISSKSWLLIVHVTVLVLPERS